MIDLYTWPTPNGHKVHYEDRGIDIERYPNVRRWVEAIAARPAVERGVAVLAERRRKGGMSDAEREVMFGAAVFIVDLVPIRRRTGRNAECRRARSGARAGSTSRWRCGH